MKHILVFTLLILLHSTSYAAEVAITLDDFNFSHQTGMPAKERNQRILSTLKEHKIKAMGFVTTKYLEDPNAQAGLAEWGAQGHGIGNHTQNHGNYSDKTFAEYSADILAADRKLKPYANFQKIFRFPYLKEGDTAAKRDAMRQFLKEKAYKNGHVTIDASDWYVNTKLIEAMKSGKTYDLETYRKFYLDHIWDRSQYYADLAKKYIGRDIKHTLLLHHNLTTALFLDDLIKMYQAKGWKVISASEAFKDPIYDSLPNTLPAGEGLVWAIAKEKGDKTLRYPAEDSRYEEAAAKKLGL